MGCATGIVKTVVFVFNLIFVIAGLALLVIGVLMKLNIRSELIDDDNFDSLALGPIFTITIGCIVFVIAFFGCWGAIRDSPCLLTTYGVILLILLIGQIAIGAYAFIQIKDEGGITDIVKKIMKTSVSKYNTDEASQLFVNETQTTFSCCGSDGAQDYLPAILLPESCCENKNIPCMLGVSWGVGCSKKLTEAIMDGGKIIGIVILCFAATELIGSILVFCLVSSINNERRRGPYA